MQRKLVVLGLLLTLIAPAFAQRGSGNRGSGTQLRQRIHQPGTGQQTGTAVQKRDRKRDGTGVNCAGVPCVQQRTQTQTETQARGETKSQVQTKTQTKTQQNSPKN